MTRRKFTSSENADSSKILGWRESTKNEANDFWKDVMLMLVFENEHYVVREYSCVSGA